VVAGNGGDAALADFLNDFIGVNMVSNEVSKTVPGIGFSGFYVIKKGLQGWKICVYVTEQGNSHNVLSSGLYYSGIWLKCLA
jgi:hypothetical protein